MRKDNKKTFFETLQTLYPQNTSELIFHTPFQLLLSVLLSAQTTDKQVNKVTSQFYETIRHPQDVLALDLETRTGMLSAVNFYRNKAKHSYKTAQILCDTSFSKKHLSDANNVFFLLHDYLIPDSQDGLTQLPGVGEKTAKVILHCLYDIPVIAVDTHVHRVSNRIGIVKTKTPAETSKIIEKRIPKEYLSTAHHCLIYFGRYHCTARSPKCETCPFTSFCQYDKKDNM